MREVRSRYYRVSGGCSLPSRLGFVRPPFAWRKGCVAPPILWTRWDSVEDASGLRIPARTAADGSGGRAGAFGEATPHRRGGDWNREDTRVPGAGDPFRQARDHFDWDEESPGAALL